MTKLKESPSQTAGPYVHIGCVPNVAGLSGRRLGDQLGSQMVSDPTLETISLRIAVLDGANEPVRDALLEIWQPGPNGIYSSTAQFHNWGRQAVDPSTGIAEFQTLKPGAPTGQAPHVLVWIVARGINLGLTTRIYFPDEDNSKDNVLRLAGSRAGTLISTKSDEGYIHTIRLQGEGETVFFDV